MNKKHCITETLTGISWPDMLKQSKQEMCCRKVGTILYYLKFYYINCIHAIIKFSTNFH